MENLGLMRRISLSLLLATLSTNLYATPQTTSLKLETRLLAYSETVSAYQFIHDWHGAFTPGENAFAQLDIAVAAQQEQWLARVGHKMDYYLRFSEDASSLYYLQQNKLDLPAEKTYDIQIAAQHVTRQYAAIGYRAELSNAIQTDIYVTAMRGSKLTQGHLQGTANTHDDDLNFDSTVNYFYSKDALFDRKVSEPCAWGFGFDSDTLLTLNPSTTARLALRDIAANLYWNNAPFTEANASSDVRQVDANGHVTIKPTVTGLESNRDFIQHLPITGYVSLTRAVGAATQATVEWNHTRWINYWNLIASQQFSDAFSATLGYLPNFGAITVGGQWRAINLSLTSDKFDLPKAKTLGMHASWITEF